MTQKEYQGKIAEYEEMLKQCRDELQQERNKGYDYLECLKNYHLVSEELREEKNYNFINNRKIEEQQKIIERYEKILDKFTINY